MTELKLKPNWEDEAEKWNDHGDPAYEPGLDAMAEDREITEKAKMLAKLDAKYQESIGEFIEAMVGVNPYGAGAAAAGVGTVGGFMKKFKEKHGEQAAKEMAEILAEEIGENSMELLGTNNKVLKKIVDWKKVGIGVAKRLGKKALTPGGLATVLVTATEVTIYVAAVLKWHGMVEDLKRAIRYESLRIDPETDPDIMTCWMRPQDDLRKFLEANPSCQIILKFTLRWIDKGTGHVKTQTRREFEVKENPDGKADLTGVWEHHVPLDLPPNACALEAVLTWTLFCPTNPRVKKVIDRLVRPVRTSTDCKAHRGELPN